MSTRSLIGYELPDGRVKYIYCHSDGYNCDEGVGPTLIKAFNSLKFTKELIKHGHTSWIDARGDSHSYISQGRDKKENAPCLAASLSEFVKGAADYGVEFVYVYKSRVWHCYDIEINNWVAMDTSLNRV